jgi:hypothetical protein
VEISVTKTLDDEYELAEAMKFRILAAMFERQGLKSVSEQFLILVTLCEEKEKILKGLVDQLVFKVEKAEGKLIEWPTLRSFPVKRQAGDN